MKYQIVRVTIPLGASVPSTYDMFQASGWKTYDWPYLKIGHYGAARVFFPATFQGASLRFKDTYLETVAPVWAQTELGGYIEVGGAQASAGLSRTISAEIFTCDLVQPVLVDSGGSPQVQSQDTVLYFVLKAA